MAKRRQTHPEMWTDVKFVSMSPLARLLFIGMWNFACDNGHLDDNALELKLRVLPAEMCDMEPLLEEVVESGMVAREDGYLKVVRLADKQALDMRYLVFCDHCENDDSRRYTEEDKTGNQRKHTGTPKSAPRAHVGHPSAAPRSGDGVGDGVGDGEGGEPKSEPKKRKSPAKPIPEDWKPNTKHLKYAAERGVEVSSEAFRFRNHAHSVDRALVNWDAAFTNWLSKAYPDRNQRASGDKRPEGW